jgi:drug/metabolite transporter (DMT)-like permease
MRALAAALVTVTLWASAFVAIRSASRQLSPEALALGRLALASVALGLLVKLRGEPLPPRRDLPAVAFCGVCWFGLYNIALNEAERRVDAGTAAMLVNLGPILIALLAGFVLREGFPPRLLAGCAIAFAGTVLIGSATSQHGLAPSWGALLCVAAAFLYAASVVVQKPLLTRASPLALTWLACMCGVVVCLPWAGTLARELPHTRASAIGAMVYLALVPLTLGFLTWGYALGRTTAGRLGSALYLVTPVAIVLGWLLLDEVPPRLAVAGGALCLVGVSVGQQRHRETGVPAEQDRALDRVEAEARADLVDREVELQLTAPRKRERELDGRGVGEIRDGHPDQRQASPLDQPRFRGQQAAGDVEDRACLRGGLVEGE